MNNAKADSERITVRETDYLLCLTYPFQLEDKIRKYATHCINDASYRNQRRTVANMTKAIQVLRNRMDEFYSQNPK